MRMLARVLLVMLPCGACSTVKISEKEHFFKPSTNDSKVYLYTVQPSETSVSQQYLSVLLLTHMANNKLSISTFLHRYDGNSQRADFAQSFTDSIQLLSESTFPINFIAAKEHSATPSYFHSFKRDKIEFEQVDPTQSISDYEVRFSKQNPFQVIETSTELKVSGVHPIQAILHSLNELDLEQESIVQIHTLDSIHKLFTQHKSERYYWFDFGMEEEYGSLFFRLSAANNLQILLNTFPSLQNLEIHVEPNPSDSGFQVGSIALKLPEGDCYVLPLKRVSSASEPAQFWTGAVEIINASTQARVGVGNLFVL